MSLSLTIWRMTGPFLLWVLAASCRNETIRKIKSPPHYNFGQVFSHKLDPALREISGIAWDNRLDEFIAHNDEAGKLFYLDKETKLIKSEISFGPKGDYEEVVVVSSVPYVLRSDGQVTRVRKDSTGKIIPEILGKVPVAGTNDFEAMYYDPVRKALILLCKNCAADQKQTVSAYALYPDSAGFIPEPVYRLDLGKIKKASPFKSSRAEPSAAAVHPVLKKLFILSSGSRQLIVAGLNGEPEGVYELGRTLFPQPEGITFKSNGDMYISNEAQKGSATILRFVYRP